VCGYMGLDSMGSSLMETQKLSFEEQPDAKVKPDAPQGCAVAPHGDPTRSETALSLASPHTLGCHIVPFLGMSWSFLPSHRSPILLCCPAVARAAARAAWQAPLPYKEPVFLWKHLFRSAAPWQASCQKFHSFLSPGTFSQ